MKRTLVFTLLAAMSLLSACNAMEGLGQDTQNAGKDLKDSANKNK